MDRPFHGHAPGSREVFWRDKSTRLYGQIYAPRAELLDKSTSLLCDLHATSCCGSSLAPLPTSSGAPGWAEVTEAVDWPRPLGEHNEWFPDFCFSDTRVHGCVYSVCRRFLFVRPCTQLRDATSHCAWKSEIKRKSSKSRFKKQETRDRLVPHPVAQERCAHSDVQKEA